MAGGFSRGRRKDCRTSYRARPKLASTPLTSLWRRVVRVTPARQVRHWKSVLLLSCWKAHSDTARFHQEVTANTGAGDQACAQANEGDTKWLNLNTTRCSTIKKV